jgi:hypothetical protein
MQALRLLVASAISLSLFATACGGGDDSDGNGGDGDGDGDVTSVRVENSSSEPVYFLFVSPCTSDSWGPDQLGDDILQAGQGKTITVEPDCYDVRAVREEDAAERRGIDVDEGEEIVVSFGNGQFTLAPAVRTRGNVIK